MEMPPAPGSMYNKDTQVHTVHYYCCYFINLYSLPPYISVSPCQ